MPMAQDPYRQGQLDGLCGLYSAVNALALLTARGRPLSRKRCQQLFACGLRFVEAHDALGQVVRQGIKPQLWFDTIRAMAADVERRQSVTLDVRRPFVRHPEVGWTQLRQAIETAVDGDAVALVQLLGALNHYSVISAHTARRFVLHDSTGLRWLDKATCGTSGMSCRHRIIATSLVTLRVMV